MSACRYLDAYLDSAAAAEPNGARAFEEHLPGCAACRSEVEAARTLRAELTMLAGSRKPATPQALRRQRLMAAAQRQQQRASVRRGVLWLGVAVSAAGLLAVLLVRQQLPVPSPPSSDSASAPLTLTLLEDVAAPAPADARDLVLDTVGGDRLLAALGDHRVGLAAGARLRIIEATSVRARLALEAGTAGFDVRPRPFADAVFEVDAGAFAIRVTGTRFLVTIGSDGALAVAVADGGVGVTAEGGHTYSVPSGQQLALDRRGQLLPSASSAFADLEGLLAPKPQMPEESAQEPASEVRAPVRGPSRNPASQLGAYRAWILDGRYADATAALQRLLRQRPDDEEAWSLLADCYRKTGQWLQAVGAYRRIIAVGRPLAANRARFLAAALLQDELADHAAAIQLLRAYRDRTGLSQPIDAAAAIRLARSLLAVGEEAEARPLLEEIVQRRPDTLEAREARRLLGSSR